MAQKNSYKQVTPMLSIKEAVFEDIEAHTGIRDDSGEEKARNEELRCQVEEVKKQLRGYLMVTGLFYPFTCLKVMIMMKLQKYFQ